MLSPHSVAVLHTHAGLPADTLKRGRCVPIVNPDVGGTDRSMKSIIAATDLLLARWTTVAEILLLSKLPVV